MSPDRDDPNPFYADCRDNEPVRFSATLGAWLVSRYEDLKTVVDDPVTYSSRNAIPSIWNNPAEVVQVFTDAGCVAEGATIVNTDEPEHAPLRRCLEHAFGGRRIRAAQPLMTRRANELIDAMIVDGRAPRTRGWSCLHGLGDDRPVVRPADAGVVPPADVPPIWRGSRVLLERLRSGARR